MSNEKCRCCASEMQASHTAFSVVKDVGAYIVRNVPCLECSQCGEVVFDQTTALKLSKYTSGKVLSYRRPINTCVFHWGDPIEEVAIPTSSRTENRSIGNPVDTRASVLIQSH